MAGTGAPLAWITGASSGIGHALALRYLADGWRVAASARRAAGLPPGAIALTLDVTDREAVRSAVLELQSGHGLPDLVVLNAGTYAPTPATKFDAEAFRAQFEVNVMGAVHGLEAVLPAMIARGRGQIAIMASVAGYGGLPGAAAYGASKAALINMAEALRLDLAGTGVDIRLICPGFVRTPLTDRNTFPMPFRIEVAEAARRIQAGLARPGFEIAFPRRFAYLLKALNLLPPGAYFRLVGRATRRSG